MEGWSSTIRIALIQRASKSWPRREMYYMTEYIEVSRNKRRRWHRGMRKVHDKSVCEMIETRKRRNKGKKEGQKRKINAADNQHPRMQYMKENILKMIRIANHFILILDTPAGCHHCTSSRKDESGSNAASRSKWKRKIVIEQHHKLGTVTNTISRSYHHMSEISIGLPTQRHQYEIWWINP